MASFRILDQAPQYLLLNGKVNAYGSLTFYETDLTTLKDTYSDEGLTILNSNPVLLDASGRSVTDIWGDGNYGVVMKSSDGATQWTRNNVRSDEVPGTAIPALVDGQFLSNDGSVLSWQPIFQVPDPTGFSGNVLGTDGVNILWQPVKEIEIPDPEISVTNGANPVFRAGVSDSATKFFMVSGSGEAPASGTRKTSTTVNFPTAFDVIWNVHVTQVHAGVGRLLVIPSQSCPSITVSAFSVTFSTDENSDFAGWNITNPVPFKWTAIGTRTIVE
jgi:hypothetical protein